MSIWRRGHVSSELNEMHPMGPPKLRGIFMGYHLNEGGFFIGDALVADWEDIEQAERVSDIPIRRLKDKEVFPKMYNKTFRFPFKEGILSQIPLASFYRVIILHSNTLPLT